MKLITAIRKLIKRKPIIMINIFGFMGEGKTNTCRYIARAFNDEFEVYYAQAPSPEEAISFIYGISGRRVIIVLDDMSFTYHGYSERVRRFENVLSRVRHITGSEKVILILSYHYIKSIAPFMRMAQIHVLTSISHNEINMLKELFRYKYLKAFLKLYDTFIWNPGKLKKQGISIEKMKPVLIRALTRHSITWIPLVEDYDFEETPQIPQPKVPDILPLEDFIIKCVNAGLGYKQSIRLARELEYKFEDKMFHDLFVNYSETRTPNPQEKVILCTKA